MEGGKREIIYLSLHCHHQNDSCIKAGSVVNHFNVSVGSDGQSNKTVSTNHSLFEEKGESKRYQTEVLPLTSLTPYRWAKPAHKLKQNGRGSYTGPWLVRSSQFIQYSGFQARSRGGRWSWTLKLAQKRS